MRRLRQVRESKTMRNVKVAEVVFLRDESELNELRINEAKNLIAQMIEMSHQRGRPPKASEEVTNAA